MRENGLRRIRGNLKVSGVSGNRVLINYAKGVKNVKSYSGYRFQSGRSGEVWCGYPIRKKAQTCKIVLFN